MEDIDTGPLEEECKTLLNQISGLVRTIRSRNNWKSSDLTELKAFRAYLSSSSQLLREKTGSISQAKVTEIEDTCRKARKCMKSV